MRRDNYMTVYLFDQSASQSMTSFSPFAITDVFTQEAGETKNAFLHFWQLDRTLILGMKDMRVPYLQQGLQSVIHSGYQPIVRNAGGLAVIADEGVLNISYIFPKSEQLRLTDEAYQVMYQLTKEALPELVIEAFEISDSYCPGTFDLSVNGKKIAGIAQRRVKNGIAVMMYLSVNGEQQRRGELVRAFYQSGLQEQFGQDGYPPVNPDSMTTLSQLLNTEMTVDQVKGRFVALFDDPTVISSLSDWLDQRASADLYRTKENSMIDRNDQIKELLHDNSL